ncbi:MAG: hypothetical protein ACRCZ2_12285, partial [Fusobacteriaceae bacterium]
MNTKKLIKLLKNEATDCFVFETKIFISINLHRVIVECFSEEKANEFLDVFLEAMSRKMFDVNHNPWNRKNFTDWEVEQIIEHHKKPRVLAEKLGRSYGSVIKKVQHLRSVGLIEGV